MIRNPIEIIFEILIFIITNTIKALITLSKLLGELFLSLAITATTSLGGLILAIIIGSVVFLFMWKYLFRTTISLLKAILVYIALVVFLFGLIVLFTSF